MAGRFQALTFKRKPSFMDDPYGMSQDTDPNAPEMSVDEPQIQESPFRRAMRNGGAIEESGGFGPSQPPAAAAPGGGYDSSRLNEAQSELQALDKPMTGKQKLLRGLASAGMIGGAVLFGGSDAALGATQGINAGMDEQAKAHQAKRKSILEELEAERNRKFSFDQNAANQGFQSGEAQKGREFTAGQTALERLQSQAQFDANLGQRRSEAAAEDSRFDRGQKEGGRQFDLRYGMDKANSDRDYTLAGRKFDLDAELGRGGLGIQGRKLDQDASQFKDSQALEREKLGVQAELKRIASGGGETARDEMVDKALETIGILEKDIPSLNPLSSGKGQAVGLKGVSSLFGLRSKPFAGSAAADYTSYVNQLQSQLALPNLTMMKGLGAMSDREFNTLSSLNSHSRLPA